MIKSAIITKRAFIALLILLQVAFYPAAVWAETESNTPPNEPVTTQVTPPAEEETPPSTETQTPPVQEQIPPPAATPPVTPAKTVYGPSKPNGAAGNTFTYNAATGLWENDYYTWDQATQSTKPKKAPIYTYNPQTGLWESVQWVYQAHTGKYEPFTVTFDHNPSPSTAAARSVSLAGTGPNSGNTTNNTSTLNSQADYYNTSGITNFLTSEAFTGDASVYANTYGGDAKSGNALTAANILNLLQSSWSPHTATFEANIDGDVVGDLVINTSGPNSTNAINVNNDTNLTTNIETDTDITNNVNLSAQSGNADVEANTHGGNATSGNADAVLNIINLLNSMISTGHSFVGTININGNFDGDILLPQDMLNYLIAHTGADSDNTLNSSTNNTLNVTDNDTQTINNNLSVNAHSGNADVTGNTTGGNATSGAATTNVTILNLTGKQVVADNAILVFINVLGRWVGAIVNAPEGSTAAALSSGPGSTNTVNHTNNTNQEINANNTTTINNNVTVDAGTGDATVKNNTVGGDATSGDASASVNIANITGSNLKLHDWFGVLFINVFGSWMGSFGVDTAAGNVPRQSPPSQQSQNAIGDPAVTAPVAAAKVFGFLASAAG